jgi:hypothetical protein
MIATTTKVSIRVKPFLFLILLDLLKITRRIVGKRDLVVVIEKEKKAAAFK